MTRKTDRRLMDANAFVMGSGPGLAVLESMFNLVNAQSVLTAGMVRDHELNQPLMLDALAYAMSDILDPCRPRAGRCRCVRQAVPVDFPDGQGGAPGQPVRAVLGSPPGGGGGTGAADEAEAPGPQLRTSSFLAAPLPSNPESDVDELVQKLKDALEQAGKSSTTTTMKTSESVQSPEEVVALLHELLDMMGGHIHDLTEIMRTNYNQGLMVT